MILQLNPVITEKSFALSEALNTYVFHVPIEVNKHQVKEAVEKEYSVTVTDVRTLRQLGKKSRSIRLGGRTTKAVRGRRSEAKKAFVTLKQGDELPVFAELKQEAEE